MAVAVALVRGFARSQLQVHRVAARNGLDVKQVATLVEDSTDGRTLGFMGEPRVLNIALQELVKS